MADIVRGDHRPEAIPDEEIAAIKALMTSVLPYDPHPYLHEGMHGILLCKEKRHRLVLGVRLIQQAAATFSRFTEGCTVLATPTQLAMERKIT